MSTIPSIDTFARCLSYLMLDIVWFLSQISGSKACWMSPCVAKATLILFASMHGFDLQASMRFLGDGFHKGDRCRCFCSLHLWSQYCYYYRPYCWCCCYYYYYYCCCCYHYYCRRHTSYLRGFRFASKVTERIIQHPTCVCLPLFLTLNTCVRALNMSRTLHISVITIHLILTYFIIHVRISFWNTRSRLNQSRRQFV